MKSYCNYMFTAFSITPWHPLTEFGDNQKTIPKTKSPSPQKINSETLVVESPLLQGLGSNAQRLLWDIMCYLFSSISTRITRLNLSGRAFEATKHEICEKNLVLESSAGQTKYLVPLPSIFEAFNQPCPYPNIKFIEHSFYICLNCFLLKKDPSVKSADQEYKIGKNGHTADISILAIDGSRNAYEITLSSTNIIQNCQKYSSTSFKQIIFLCRNYDLSQAVNSTILAANLPHDLFDKIEVLPFSQLLKRSRKYYSMI